MAVPTRDELLVAWGSNFDTKGTASPITYNLTAAQMTQFHTLYLAFVAAYDAVAAARANGTRSVPLTTLKDTAKKNLLAFARQLYGFVQDALTVAADKKQEIGVVVKKTEPTPVPPPADAPEIDVLSTAGRTVRARLHAAGSTRRARPDGVTGAAVFTHVGNTAPSELSDWTFEANVSKTTIDIVFPPTTPNGATVWITAYWFNQRKQAGPVADPVTVNIPGGSVSAAA